MKHQIFCKGNILFFKKKTIWKKNKKKQRPLGIVHSIKQCVIFLKRGVVAGHLFLQTYCLLLEDELSHQLLHVGWFIHVTVAVIHSFRGYMEQIIFDSSYLLRIATFLEELFLFDIFKSSLFVSPLWLISFLPWSRISVFVTERVAVVCFLKENVFILTGNLAVIHCLLEQFFQH